METEIREQGSTFTSVGGHSSVSSDSLKYILQLPWTPPNLPFQQARPCDSKQSVVKGRRSPVSGVHLIYSILYIAQTLFQLHAGYLLSPGKSPKIHPAFSMHSTSIFLFMVPKSQLKLKILEFNFLTFFLPLTPITDNQLSMMHPQPSYNLIDIFISIATSLIQVLLWGVSQTLCWCACPLDLPLVKYNIYSG